VSILKIIKIFQKYKKKVDYIKYQKYSLRTTKFRETIEFKELTIVLKGKFLKVKNRKQKPVLCKELKKAFL